MEIKNRAIQSQAKIIDKLILCENSISELYALYSKIFRDQNEFWAALSKEEHKHAMLLQSMHKQLAKGELFHNIGRFDTTTIAAFLVEINAAITNAKENSISPMQGIKVGIFIESSLLDSHFYDIVKSDDDAFKEVAGKLSEDTQRHVKIVQDKLMEMLKEETDAAN